VTSKLVREGEASHTRLDAEDVVVDREHVERGHGGVTLRGNDGHLRVIDAREVACAGRLVLFGLERERVRVDTGHGGTGVMVVGLHLVEVLTGLLLETVLAVEHELHVLDRTRRFFIEGGGDNRTRTGDQLGAVTGIKVGVDKGTGEAQVDNIGGHAGRGLREVPHGNVGHVSLGGAPHEFLDGVVVRQTDLLGRLGSSKCVRSSVLHLLDQVFMTLLGESPSFFRVQVDVVGPHLEGLRGVHVHFELSRQVEIQTDFVVLEGDEGKRQTGVAVEEEDQGKEHLSFSTGRAVHRTRGHLTPRSLLRGVEVQFGVHAPPLLVVLVDALTTDGQLNILDRTLGNPRVVEGTGGGGDGRETGSGLHFNVHVSDEITVTGDGHGHATGVTGGTVDSLFDVFHREVCVATVNRLEESNFGVTGKVDILGTVSDELHETTGHFESIVLYTNILFHPRKTRHYFSSSYINVHLRNNSTSPQCRI
tara:strand:- start:7019 stop:8449 length:1431 start_codon:yes stop_codon:yes gene_type:complete